MLILFKVFKQCPIQIAPYLSLLIDVHQIGIYPPYTMHFHPDNLSGRRNKHINMFVLIDWYFEPNDKVCFVRNVSVKSDLLADRECLQVGKQSAYNG